MAEKKALTSNEPQDIEDCHDTKYDNDVSLSSWLRNGKAESMPHYDRGNSWRQKDGNACPPGGEHGVTTDKPAHFPPRKAG